MSEYERAAVALERALTELLEACESRTSAPQTLERRAARVETTLQRLAAERARLGTSVTSLDVPAYRHCLELHALVRASTSARRDETHAWIERTRAVRRNLASLCASADRGRAMDRRG